MSGLLLLLHHLAQQHEELRAGGGMCITKRSNTVCGSTCSCKAHGQVGQASSSLSTQLSMQLASSTGPHWHW